MRRGIVVLAFGGLLLAAACNLTTREFLCATHNECPAADGTYGLCVRGHCAFRSDSCDSGWIYDETGGSVASTCVPAADLTTDAGPSGPDADPTPDAAAPGDAAGSTDAAASGDAAVAGDGAPGGDAAIGDGGAPDA